MRLLDKAGFTYQLQPYEYDPENLDVSLIASQNGLALESIYKTLVLQGDKTGLIVAVVPGHCSLDLKAAAKISGNKRVFMLPQKDLEKNTGYIRGGCCPFGMKKNFPVYVDQRGEDLETLFVNAGKRGILIGITPEALDKVARATFGEIASIKE